MIDRGDLTDDQRNEVNIEQQRVKLHREHSQRLDNGFYIGKLMQSVRKSIIKKSKRPFTLDPILSNLKDQATKQARQYNWNYIFIDLRKFNIKLSSEQKSLILENQHQEQITDLLVKLQEYDQNLGFYTQATSPGSQNKKDLIQQNDYKDESEKNDINSEIQFGGMANGEAIEKTIKRTNFDAAASDYNHNGRASNIGNSKSTAFLMQAPLKKNFLEPIDQNDNVKRNKSIIQLHSMKQVSPRIADNLSGYYNQSDDMEGTMKQQYMTINEQEKASAELSESQNATIYIITSLRISMGMRQNQVGILLANNHKFFIQLCVKGMKGADYSKLLNWYSLLRQNIGQLMFLFQSDPQQMKPSLSILKCGLFSQNAEVVNQSCRVITKIAAVINENQASMAHLRGLYDEWMYMAQPVVIEEDLEQTTPLRKSPKRTRPPINSPPTKGKKVQNKKNPDLDNFLTETGLKAFLRAHHRHGGEFIETFSAFLVQASYNNHIEFFTQQLRLSCDSNSHYLSVIQDVYTILFQTANGRTALIDSGVLNMLIDVSLQVADQNMSQVISNAYDSQYSFQGDPKLAQVNNERQLALTLLVDFWRTKPEIIQSQQNDGRATDAIMGVLKKGARDRSKVVSLLSMNLMSALLDDFAKDRNKYAPIIYKALTFILIECFSNMELREEMLNNFISLFKKQPNIPIQILCDPLLKQIWINLEKQEDFSIIQAQNSAFNLNSIDFEFFMNIAIHPKLSTNIAVQLLQIVSDISRKNIIFTRISLKLVLTILSRFENNTQIFEFCQGQIRNVMKIIADQDTVKSELYGQLLRDPKTRVHAKKKKTLAINQSMDQAEFSHVVNKNSVNVKYLGGAAAMTKRENRSLEKDKTRGIVGGGGDIGNVEYFDDSDLQAALNPQLYQQESAQYMQMVTREKLIINQLQCFINTGIKVLVEYIRQQLLDTYIKIEKKLKFKNKGILYLLAIFEKDVTKMLQYYYKEQSAKKADRIKQKRQLKDFDAINTAMLTTGESEQYLNSIDQIRTANQSLNLRDNSPYDIYNNFDKVTVPYPLKANAPTMRKKKNSIISNSIDKTGAVNDYSSLNDRSRSIQHSQEYGSILKNKRTMGEPVAVRALTIGNKAKPEEERFKLFDIIQTNDIEVEKYVIWLKQHLKLYKAMFHKYATVSTSKIQIKKLTFDDMKEQKNLMSLTEVFSFLNDFKITSTNQIKREQVKKMIKLINLKNQSPTKGSSDLDLGGFIELILQLGYYMNNQIERPSIFLPLLFKYFKEVSLTSDKPLFQRLFQDPQASSIGDPELIKELTRQVNLDPEYKLPPGFVKFKQDVIVEKFQVPDDMNEAEKISLQILNDIYYSIFGSHYVNPQADYEEKWIVKPDIFQKNKNKNLQPKYQSIGEKYQFKPKGQKYYDREQTVQMKTPQPQIGRQGKALKSQPRIGGASMQLSVTQKANKLISPRFNSTKRPPKMESTLNPNLSVALKVQLANSSNAPNHKHLKESIFMMEDMLRAVENGQRELSPKTRAKIYDESQKNQFIVQKQEKERQNKEQERVKQEKFLNRQAVLKKKLTAFQNQKQQQQLSKMDKQKTLMQKNLERQQKKEQDKKEYYESIKNDYNKNRLPEIQKKNQEKSQKDKLDKTQRLKQAEQAEKKIAENIQSMMKKFEEQNKKRRADEEERKKKEEEERNQQKQRNEHLSQNYALRQNASTESLSGRGGGATSASPNRGVQKKGTIRKQSGKKAAPEAQQPVPVVQQAPQPVPQQQQLPPPVQAPPPKKKKLFGIF